MHKKTNETLMKTGETMVSHCCDSCSLKRLHPSIADQSTRNRRGEDVGTLLPGNGRKHRAVQSPEAQPQQHGYGCPCVSASQCRSGHCYRRSCADDVIQGVVAAELNYADLHRLLFGAVASAARNEGATARGTGVGTTGKRSGKLTVDGECGTTFQCQSTVPTETSRIRFGEQGKCRTK